MVDDIRNTAGPRPNVPAVEGSLKGLQGMSQFGRDNYGGAPTQQKNWGPGIGVPPIDLPKGPLNDAFGQVEPTGKTPGYNFSSIMDEIQTAFDAGDWDALGSLEDKYPGLADSFNAASGNIDQEYLDRRDYLNNMGNDGYGIFDSREQKNDFLKWKLYGNRNEQGKKLWYGPTRPTTRDEWEQGTPTAMQQQRAGEYKAYMNNLLEQSIRYPKDFNSWKGGLSTDPEGDINTIRFIDGKLYLPGQAYDPNPSDDASGGNFENGSYQGGLTY